MTLAHAVLSKVKSRSSRTSKFSSPPPEVDEDTMKKKRKKPVYKYEHVRGVVDTSPPQYDALRLLRPLSEWQRRLFEMYRQNIQLLTAIKQTHFSRGRVDSRWARYPPCSPQYYKRRVDFYKRLQFENHVIYKRIQETISRVVPTSHLRRDWAHNRQQIIHRAQNKFVLFPPVPQEIIEDAAFAPPPGVKRPRVYLTLRMEHYAVMGDLCAELFSDVCPATCRLFLQLLAGDGCGYGYVGTCFFRKVPELFWSGGDVIYDNGCGCYAQPGLRVPIGAENYHFPHSMPGLLSMRVTRDDEMCGMFNITFKPMPQFDLRNIVFGRIVRPCSTFSSMQSIGSALSAQPVVRVSRARLRAGRRWVCGAPNTRLARAVQWIRD